MLYTRRPPRTTDDEILSQFYNLYQHLRHWPSMKEFRQYQHFFTLDLKPIHERFGGHQATIAATKVTYGLLTPAESKAIAADREQILAQLAKYYGDLSYWQSRSAFLNDMRIAKITDFSRCCGGLDTALRELGLPVCFPTRDDLIAALQKAEEDLGAPPRLIDAEEKVCLYPYSAFLNEFETWNQALLAADMPVNLDQPNRRETYARRKYSLYRHPNQRCLPREPQAICAIPS